MRSEAAMMVSRVTYFLSLQVYIPCAPLACQECNLTNCRFVLSNGYSLLAAVSESGITCGVCFLIPTRRHTPVRLPHAKTAVRRRSVARTGIAGMRGEAPLCRVYQDSGRRR